MRGQRGQTTAEYMGLLVLVAAIVAALGAIGLGGLMGDAVKHSICLMVESLDAECHTEASERDPNAPNGDLAPNRPPASSTQTTIGPITADLATTGDRVVFASYGADPPGYDCFEPVPPDALRVPRSPCQREYDQRTEGRFQQPPPPPDLAPGQTPLDTLELIIQALAPDPSQLPEAASALLDLPILEATDRALQAVGGGRYRAARDAARRTLDAIRDRIPGSRGRDRDRDRPPVRAPGRYVDKNESMSDASRRYQQAQGAQPGKAYRVDSPDGPVDFDAFQDGTLIDAKGRYDQLLDKPFTPMVNRKLVQQARRQARAAGTTPVQWRFAEPQAAR